MSTPGHTPDAAARGRRTTSPLALAGLLAAGVLGTTATVVLLDPAAPPASAAGLTRFTDCDSLRSWYVQRGLEEVGPWGWGGRVLPLIADGAATRESVASGPADAVANGPTGTNVQESGVDEPDVAKTDGRVVVRLQEGRRLVVTDVTGADAREVGSWSLPQDSYADGLLLVGDHALLVGGSAVAPTLEDSGLRAPEAGVGTVLFDVDLGDPADPRLVDRRTWPGRQVSLRQYGETVRLVTATGLPALPFVQPEPGVLGEREAERRNRELVRDSRVEDWAPGVRCDEVYRPDASSGTQTVLVTTLRAGALDADQRVAVAGAGSEVYSSTDRLYVTATEWSGGPVLDRPMVGPDAPVEPGISPPPQKVRTHLHAFALDGDRTSYLASGVVQGRVRDRWSLDEHEGHLRVAVGWPSRTGRTQENGVVVLDERGDRLVQVGELAGLGIGEDIQSVRWFDDLAVVVTFRQVDPLYTIDLSDPTAPRRLGELKIPGFSAYLHPIGEDRLLGLGTDATLQGENLGAQAAVYDIGEVSRARQVDKVTFGHASYFPAAQDPRAFTWLPGARAAVASLQQEDRSTMLLLRVGGDGSLTVGDLPEVSGYNARALPLPDDRVALVGDSVRVVGVAPAD